MVVVTVTDVNAFVVQVDVKVVTHHVVVVHVDVDEEPSGAVEIVTQDSSMVVVSTVRVSVLSHWSVSVTVDIEVKGEVRVSVFVVVEVVSTVDVVSLVVVTVSV